MRSAAQNLIKVARPELVCQDASSVQPNRRKNAQCRAQRSTGGLGGQAGRRQTRVRAAPLPPLLVTPLINHKHKITNTMAGGGRVVAALAALCAARAMTTNATWCSARNHRRLAGGCVHSLRPALPHAAAARLGALLQRAWQQNSFLYATNCVRRGDACECGNKKLRMDPKDSAASQAAAVYCRDKRGGFIYSKHELDRSSTAHSILANTVDSLIRPRLEEAIGGPVANLTDWFASAFQSGGWLGVHTDVGLGHVAFVLNLTPDENAFRGGDLEFAEGHVAGGAEIKSSRRVPARWRGGAACTRLTARFARRSWATPYLRSSTASRPSASAPARFRCRTA